MVRLSAAFATLCLLVPSAVSARPAALQRVAAAPQPAVAFAISGRGWGHGVGMSQYGALGFAQNGVDYASILGHYYPGTELGQATIGRVRVLLADARKALSIGSDAAFSIRDATGTTYELEPATLRLGPGLKVKVDPAAEAVALTAPVVFTGRGGPLEVQGKAYRGTVEVSLVNGRLRAVNAVGLEAYLFGVVPREVPSDWPAEALKAQAVVARSYALAVRRPGGAFDLFADTRSQVYGGLAAEQPETTAAVLATVGQVLLFEGRVATTFFFSTSGGRTADVTDVWPGSEPVPYLVSVPDPYDTLSPHHQWGPFPFTGPRLVRAFALPAIPVDARVTTNGSGRAADVVFVGADGSETTVPAATVRAKLGLRSTWIRVGVLALDAPAKTTVAYGTTLRLTGRARALTGLGLEQRVSGGVWERTAVTPARDGAVALAVKPQATVDFRLAAGKVATPTLRIRVAAAVRLDTPTAPTGLAGAVRPIVPGATVTIQRQAGTKWTNVATAAVDETGAFRAEFALVAGTYRARVALGGGYAVGLSKILEVVDA